MGSFSLAIWARLAFWFSVRSSGFLQRAYRDPLDDPGQAALVGKPGLVPDLAPDLVESVGRPLDDVEGVQADLSSMPIRTRPRKRSRPPDRSSATRLMMPPTVGHEMRISPDVAVFEHCLASHAVVSSNARVKMPPWRAHGTRATITPWRRQRTRGASASTKAKVTPRSSVRQRRMPAPRSQPGLRRPQMPQPPVPAPQAHPDDDPSCFLADAYQHRPLHAEEPRP